MLKTIISNNCFGGANGKRQIEQNFNIKEFLEVDR